MCSNMSEKEKVLWGHLCLSPKGMGPRSHFSLPIYSLSFMQSYQELYFSSTPYGTFIMIETNYGIQMGRWQGLTSAWLHTHPYKVAGPRGRRIKIWELQYNLITSVVEPWNLAQWRWGHKIFRPSPKGLWRDSSTIVKSMCSVFFLNTTSECPFFTFGGARLRLLWAQVLIVDMLNLLQLCIMLLLHSLINKSDYLCSLSYHAPALIGWG